jgi:hypothetical protein
MTIDKQEFDKLAGEQKDELLNHLQSAIYHLAACWDSLSEAESVIGGEIEIEDISGITSDSVGTGSPGDAFGLEWDSLERIFGDVRPAEKEDA